MRVTIIAGLFGAALLTDPTLAQAPAGARGASGGGSSGCCEAAAEKARRGKARRIR